MSAPVPLAAASCAVCGSPEPFDLAICPACAGTAPGADTLVFLARPTDRSARRHAEGVIGAALGRAARVDAVRAGAAGVAPIARVPEPIADRMAARLADDGVVASLVPVARAHERIPMALTLLVAAASAAGLTAGAQGTAPLVWLTPMMVFGLLGWAWWLARRPVWRPRSVGPRLMGPGAAVAARALAELPDGGARRLLGALVHHARAAVPLRHVEPVLAAACAAAGTLARLEDDLAVLERAAGEGRNARARDGVLARAERARAALTERLGDVAATLARLRVASSAGLAAADARELESLTRDLETEARLNAEAVSEVEALLRELPVRA